MKRLPERRKPAAWGARAGHQEVESVRDVSKRQDNPNPRDLQAFRIRNRFALSWPLAVVIAEHAFGGGSA